MKYNIKNDAYLKPLLPALTDYLWTNGRRFISGMVKWKKRKRAELRVHVCQLAYVVVKRRNQKPHSTWIYARNRRIMIVYRRALIIVLSVWRFTVIMSLGWDSWCESWAPRKGHTSDFTTDSVIDRVLATRSRFWFLSCDASWFQFAVRPRNQQTRTEISCTRPCVTGVPPLLSFVLRVYVFFYAVFGKSSSRCSRSCCEPNWPPDLMWKVTTCGANMVSVFDQVVLWRYTVIRSRRQTYWEHHPWCIIT